MRNQYVIALLLGSIKAQLPTATAPTAADAATRTAADATTRADADRAAAHTMRQ